MKQKKKKKIKINAKNALLVSFTGKLFNTLKCSVRVTNLKDSNRTDYYELNSFVNMSF